MADPAEKRRFRRYAFAESPVLVEIPDLSLVMLEPENLSWGGFESVESELDVLGLKLKLSSPLRPLASGLKMECNLEVAGEFFQGLAAQVRWVSLEDMKRAEWTLGMLVTLPGEELDRFRAAMKASHPYLLPEV
jgi:hypothetical protein